MALLIPPPQRRDRRATVVTGLHEVRGSWGRRRRRHVGRLDRGCYGGAWIGAGRLSSAVGLRQGDLSCLRDAIVVRRTPIATLLAAGAVAATSAGARSGCYMVRGDVGCAGGAIIGGGGGGAAALVGLVVGSVLLH